MRIKGLVESSTMANLEFHVCLILIIYLLGVLCQSTIRGYFKHQESDGWMPDRGSVCTSCKRGQACVLVQFLGGEISGKAILATMCPCLT